MSKLKQRKSPRMKTYSELACHVYFGFFTLALSLMSTVSFVIMNGRNLHCMPVLQQDSDLHSHLYCWLLEGGVDLSTLTMDANSLSRNVNYFSLLRHLVNHGNANVKIMTKTKGSFPNRHEWLKGKFFHNLPAKVIPTFCASKLIL